MGADHDECPCSPDSEVPDGTGVKPGTAMAVLGASVAMYNVQLSIPSAEMRATKLLVAIQALKVAPSFPNYMRVTNLTEIVSYNASDADDSAYPILYSGYTTLSNGTTALDLMNQSDIATMAVLTQKYYEMAERAMVISKLEFPSLTGTWQYADGFTEVSANLMKSSQDIRVVLKFWGKRLFEYLNGQFSEQEQGVFSFGPARYSFSMDLSSAKKAIDGIETVIGRFGNITLSSLEEENAADYLYNVTISGVALRKRLESIRSYIDTLEASPMVPSSRTRLLNEDLVSQTSTVGRGLLETFPAGNAQGRIQVSDDSAPGDNFSEELTPFDKDFSVTFVNKGAAHFATPKLAVDFFVREIARGSGSRFQRKYSKLMRDELQAEFRRTDSWTFRSVRTFKVAFAKSIENAVSGLAADNVEEFDAARLATAVSLGMYRETNTPVSTDFSASRLISKSLVQDVTDLSQYAAVGTSLAHERASAVYDRLKGDGGKHVEYCHTLASSHHGFLFKDGLPDKDLSVENFQRKSPFQTSGGLSEHDFYSAWQHFSLRDFSPDVYFNKELDPKASLLCGKDSIEQKKSVASRIVEYHTSVNLNKHAQPLLDFRMPISSIDAEKAKDRLDRLLRATFPASQNGSLTSRTTPENAMARISLVNSFAFGVISEFMKYADIRNEALANRFHELVDDFVRRIGKNAFGSQQRYSLNVSQVEALIAFLADYSAFESQIGPNRISTSKEIKSLLERHPDNIERGWKASGQYASWGKMVAPGLGIGKETITVRSVDAFHTSFWHRSIASLEARGGIDWNIFELQINRAMNGAKTKQYLLDAAQTQVIVDEYKQIFAALVSTETAVGKFTVGIEGTSSDGMGVVDLEPTLSGKGSGSSKRSIDVLESKMGLQSKSLLPTEPFVAKYNCHEAHYKNGGFEKALESFSFEDKAGSGADKDRQRRADALARAQAAGSFVSGSATGSNGQEGTVPLATSAGEDSGYDADVNLAVLLVGCATCNHVFTTLESTSPKLQWVGRAVRPVVFGAFSVCTWDVAQSVYFTDGTANTDDGWLFGTAIRMFGNVPLLNAWDYISAATTMYFMGHSMVSMLFMMYPEPFPKNETTMDGYLNRYGASALGSASLFAIMFYRTYGAVNGDATFTDHVDTYKALFALVAGLVKLGADDYYSVARNKTIELRGSSWQITLPPSLFEKTLSLRNPETSPAAAELCRTACRSWSLCLIAMGVRAIVDVFFNTTAGNALGIGYLMTILCFSAWFRDKMASIEAREIGASNLEAVFRDMSDLTKPERRLSRKLSDGLEKFIGGDGRSFDDRTAIEIMLKDKNSAFVNGVLADLSSKSNIELFVDEGKSPDILRAWERISRGGYNPKGSDGAMLIKWSRDYDTGSGKWHFQYKSLKNTGSGPAAIFDDLLENYETIQAAVTTGRDWTQTMAFPIYAASEAAIRNLVGGEYLVPGEGTTKTTTARPTLNTTNRSVITSGPPLNRRTETNARTTSRLGPAADTTVASQSRVLGTWGQWLGFVTASGVGTAGISSLSAMIPGLADGALKMGNFFIQSGQFTTLCESFVRYVLFPVFLLLIDISNKRNSRRLFNTRNPARAPSVERAVATVKTATRGTIHLVSSMSKEVLDGGGQFTYDSATRKLAELYAVSVDDIHPIYPRANFKTSFGAFSSGAVDPTIIKRVDETDAITGRLRLCPGMIVFMDADDFLIKETRRAVESAIGIPVT